MTTNEDRLKALKKPLGPETRKLVDDIVRKFCKKPSIDPAVEKTILEYIKKVGFFDVPEYEGGYDDIPFTHENYCDYVVYLERKFHKKAKDYSDHEHGIEIEVIPFEVDGEGFVLRSLWMGVGCHQLFTRDCHQKDRPNEP